MLSVIVPVWCPTAETAAMAERNVRRLREVAQVPTEIVTIENGSSFHTRLPSDAGVVFAVNKGIAPAWNWGAQNSRGSLLAFVTLSTAVEPGWDTALAKPAGEGLIAFPLTEEGDGVFQKHRAGTGIAGWCWMIPRSMYERVGPFDETFVPAGYEDTDWFHRALDLGYTMTSVPDAHVHHAPRSTTDTMDRRNLLFWSLRWRYAWKHNVDPHEAPPFWKQPVPDYNPHSSSK